MGFTDLVTEGYKESYKKSEAQSLLRQYPEGLNKFIGDEVGFIVLDKDEVDLIFDIAIAYYYILWLAKKKEEEMLDAYQEATNAINIANAALGLIGTAVPLVGIISGAISAAMQIIDFAVRKFRSYPKEIDGLPNIIHMFIRWAQISESNQNILMQGAYNYVNMQKEEYDDFVQEDGYVELGTPTLEFIWKVFLPNFKAQVYKAMSLGKDAAQIQIPEKYPQAPGKDDTNEIDFPSDPMRETIDEKQRRTSESDSPGAVLDFIRCRQSAEQAGGDKYDYEYSKLGWDIQLAKTPYKSPIKDFAAKAGIRQVVVQNVLTLCSYHYVKEYKKYLLGWNDKLKVESNIPTDMAEEEINPWLKKYNAQSCFDTMKTQQNRYNAGYRPLILGPTLLELIDESTEAYIEKYNKLYDSLPPELQAQFAKIILNSDGSLTQIFSIESYYDTYLSDDEEYVESVLIDMKNIQDKRNEYNALKSLESKLESQLSDSDINSYELSDSLSNTYENLNSTNPNLIDQNLDSNIDSLHSNTKSIDSNASFLDSNFSDSNANSSLNSSQNPSDSFENNLDSDSNIYENNDADPNELTDNPIDIALHSDPDSTQLLFLTRLANMRFFKGGFNLQPTAVEKKYSYKDKFYYLITQGFYFPQLMDLKDYNGKPFSISYAQSHGFLDGPIPPRKAESGSSWIYEIWYSINASEEYQVKYYCADPQALYDYEFTEEKDTAGSDEDEDDIKKQLKNKAYYTFIGYAYDNNYTIVQNYFENNKIYTMPKEKAEEFSINNYAYAIRKFYKFTYHKKIDKGRLISELGKMSAALVAYNEEKYGNYYENVDLDGQKSNIDKLLESMRK